MNSRICLSVVVGIAAAALVSTASLAQESQLKSSAGLTDPEVRGACRDRNTGENHRRRHGHLRCFGLADQGGPGRMACVQNGRPECL